MSTRTTAVLLVDDDDSGRVQSLLETVYGDGLRLDREAGEEGALRALESGRYDVALVADRLGPKGGLDLIRTAVRRGYTVPLVVLVDQDGPAATTAALRAGAVDALTRGRVDADTLERVIRFAARQRQTEEALRESRSRYDLLFEAIPRPMFVYDVETLALLDVNAAAIHLYGYTREEFLGLSIADLRPPEDVPRLMAWMRGYKDRPYTTASAWRHRKKDGTVIDVEVTSNAVRQNGRPTRVALIRDVTEQRRAEQAVRESERFARGVLDSFLAHVAVVGADGVILAVNRGWRESAVTKDNCFVSGVGEGTNYLALCDSTEGEDAPAAAKLAAGLRAVLGGKDTSFTLDYVCRMPEERPWVVRVLPFWGEGPPRAVVAHLDITDRKHAEDALLESEQRLQAIIDSSKAVIYLKDLAGRYILVNRHWTELFKVSKESVVGKSDYDLFPRRIAEAFRANDRIALDLGRAIEVEEVAPHADGPHTFLSVKAPLYDVHGVAYATCGISTDITYRLRAEEALRQSEERFRAAFDSAINGVAIVVLDGRFVEVNQSFCTLTGYTEDELLVTNFQAITHPDDLEEDLALMHRLVAGEISTYQLEKRYIHKKGHVVWGVLSVSVVRDVHGEPVNLVAQVVDVTLRKKAETALSRSLDRLMRLRQLDQTILSVPVAREVASKALDHLRELIPCCCCSVDVHHSASGRTSVLASWGRVPACGDAMVIPLEAIGPACPPARRATQAVASDSPEDPSGAGAGDGDRHLHVRQPLAYKGRALGTLNICFDHSVVPDAEHMEVAREVADLLAIALRQARLFRQVRRARRRLSALTQQLITAQEAERRRLARELHDEIGQSLTALKLGIQAGADTADPATRKSLAHEGRQLIDQLIDQVRNLSLDLRPSMLDDFGLVSALRWYVDRLARRSGIEAKLAADPQEIRAPAAVETACFRIAQEALTNVTRYASARHVWVELRREGPELSMVVRDDGVGFDTSLVRERAARGTGLGLLGMRERAALLGGRIDIASAPGEGTRVHVTIPLSPPDRGEGR